MLVQHRVLPDGTTQPDLTPCGQVAGNQKEVLRKLVVQAKEDWKAPDHPNWSVRDMDSGQFLDSMQPGQVSGHRVFSCFQHHMSTSVAHVMHVKRQACNKQAAAAS